MQQQVIKVVEQVTDPTPFDWTPIIVAVITAIVGPLILYQVRRRRGPEEE